MDEDLGHDSRQSPTATVIVAPRSWTLNVGVLCINAVLASKESKRDCSCHPG